MQRFFSILLLFTCFSLQANESNIENLIQKLAGKERKKAYKQLRQLDTKAIKALVVALKNPEKRIRRFAAQLLGEIGPKASIARHPLFALYTDPDAMVNNYARKAISQITGAPRSFFFDPFSGYAFRNYKMNPISKQLYHKKDFLVPITQLQNQNAPLREKAIAKWIEKKETTWPILLSFLKDSDVYIKEMVIKALKDIKSQEKFVAPALIELLKDTQWGVRFLAVKTLGDIKAKSSAIELIKLLKDPDLKVQQETIIALGNIKSVEALPSLMILAKKESLTRSVLKALALLGPKAQTATALLEKMLSSPDQEIRLLAVKVLGKINKKEIVPLLKKAIKDIDKDVNFWAKEILQNIQIDSAKRVQQLFESLKKRENKIHVKELLEMMGEKIIVPLVASLSSDLSYDTWRVVEKIGKPTVPYLAKALYNKKAQTKALQILQQIGPDALAAVPDILKTMEKSSWRYNAQKALNEIGPKSIPLLLKALKTKNQEFQKSIIETIVLMGPDARALIPYLENLALTGKYLQKFSALAGLEKIGTAAIPTLIKLLKKKELMHLVTSTFSNIEPRATQAIPALIQVAQTKSFRARYAIEALGDICSNTKNDKVIALLKEQFIQNVSQRKDILDALFQIGPASLVTVVEFLEITTDKKVKQFLIQMGEKAIPALNEKLKHSKGSINKHIVEILEEIKPQQKRTKVIKKEINQKRLLANLKDKNYLIIKKAALKLLKMGPKAAFAIDDLLIAVKDDHYMVCQCAIRTLKQIKIKTPKVVAALTAALNDGSLVIEAEAALALSSMGVHSIEITKTLLNRIKKKEKKENMWIYKSKWQLKTSFATIAARTKGTFPLLIKTLKDPQNTVREAAAMALMEKKLEFSLLPQLLEFLKDKNSLVKISLLASLMQAMPKKTPLFLPHIKKLFKDPNSTVRMSAAGAWLTLGKEPLPEALKILTIALNHSDQKIRITAASMLAQAGFAPPKAIFILLETLYHKSQEARELAAIGLMFVQEELEYTYPMIVNMAKKFSEKSGYVQKVLVLVLVKTLQNKKTLLHKQAAQALEKIRKGALKDKEISEIITKALNKN